MKANPIEEQRSKDLINPNGNYGGTYKEYFFGQSDFEVVVHFHLPEAIKRNEIAVIISTNRISVNIPGIKTVGCSILEGELYRPIKASESSWCIEDRKELIITLIKMNLSGGDEWWPCVVKGEPEINMKKFIPPPGRLQDLDEAGQAAVEKLIQEQIEKRSLGIA